MKTKILIVEDDPATRFMMSEMCEILGHESEAAVDGTECLKKLQLSPNKYSVILMDIHMPLASGPETCDAIRRLGNDPPRHTPIVAITADVNWHNATKCKACGFNSVLAKPIKISELGDTLTKLSA